MRKRSFDFTSEVCVSRRIDDVDFDAVVDDAGVLRPDGNAPLSFLVHGIHNALAHVIDLPMHVRLAKDGIDQRGLAVVYVGDDGDIPDIRSASLRRTEHGWCGRRHDV